MTISKLTNATLPIWRQTFYDYITLTKPRVVSLLLFTTLAAMFITPAGAPPWHLVAWTLIGGYLMAGGANAVNMALDNDIDRRMGRTSKRPVPSGRITPRQACAFGLVLAGLSLLVFLLFVNWLTAMLAAAGFLYYTVIYTKLLKRNTWQNIVIGGGAGAIPPMIGWAATSGQLSLVPLVLFAIVFYWTPPHFWALALLKREDYAAAGVPMLPVVAGNDETARQILLYSFGMFALTLVLVPVQAMGSIYLTGAIALGIRFLWLAWRVNREHTRHSALKLYVFSLHYLFALFAVMMADRILL
jgi:protoheme IX farnesyltransferase